jgi:hypothetical protein
MKRICVLVVVLVFLGTSVAFAERPIEGKKFEFSTAVSFSSAKYTNSDNSVSILIIPVRLGWFIWKGFEIEPEVQLRSFDGGTLLYFLQGNLTYNFKTPWKLIPFIGACAGFGNDIPVITIGGPNGDKVSAYGGIAGVRCLIGKSAALRAEYRFSWWTHNAPWMGDYGPDKGTLNAVFVGLSIFF